jgi:hypothetical protein
MEVILLLLFLLMPLLIRLVHFLVLIPASRNFRRLIVPKDNKNYLLRTIAYLFLGLLISVAFVILINKGGSFVGFQGNVLKNAGFLRWIKTINPSDFELADFQFLECLLVFYLISFIYVLFISFIKRRKFDYLTKQYLLNSIFGFVFVIMGIFVLFIHLPVTFDMGIDTNFQIVANLILFFSMWILFAWLPTKNFSKYSEATPIQKKSNIITHRLRRTRPNLGILLIIALIFIMIAFFIYQKSYKVYYPAAVWSPNSDKVVYLKEVVKETMPYERLFLGYYDLLSKEHRIIKEFVLPNSRFGYIDYWNISKDGVIVYNPDYRMGNALVLMSLEGDVIDVLDAENIVGDVAWSFDGKRIFYEIVKHNPKYEYELWVMDRNGTNRFRIDNGDIHNVFPSPTNNKLVYECKKDGESLIRVVDLEDEKVKVVKEWKPHDIFLECENGEYIHYYGLDPIGWMPDGKAIIIKGDVELYKLDLSSDKTKRLGIQTRSTPIILSPNLKKVIYFRGGTCYPDGFFEIVDVETGNQELFIRVGRRLFF